MAYTNIPNELTHKEEKPEILFKYRCFNLYHLDILRKKQVWFSKPETFNDPFDCLIPLRFDLLTEAEFDQKAILTTYHISNDKLTDDPRKRLFPVDASPEEAIEFYFTMMKGNPKFAQYSPEKMKEMMKWQLDHLRENVTVFSLAKEWDNILMWSHYAGNHTGFCIGFDTDLLFKSTGNGIGRVEYDDFPKLKPVKNEKYHIAQALSKAKKWEYEKEWRLIHWNKRNAFDIDPKCIKQIILGYAVSDGDKKIMTDLINNDPKLGHVKYLQAEQEPYSYALKITSLI